MIIKTIKIPVLEWRIVPAAPKSSPDTFMGTVGLAMSKFSYCKMRRVPAKLQFKQNNRWHDAAECVEESSDIDNA